MVAGGDNASNTELYDPSVGTWATACEMITPRYFHTATLLLNGKLLAVGGVRYAGNDVLSISEIYRSGTGATTTITLTNPAVTSNGGFCVTFTNAEGANFSVLATTSPALPLTNWTVLGGVMEVSPGLFQFTDPQATNYTKRFYRVRSR
jgi:hypothetical protein